MPKLEPELSHLMDWFHQVQGSSRLTWTELKAWSEMTCTNLKPYEAEALMVLDRMYWSVLNG
ncbi:hypothetical protein PHAGE_BARTON_17 [Acinetobacter phage Barton]|nr:hypothetical protein PHAGE_BARTON_17 [Acinetobacter phage Barton]